MLEILVLEILVRYANEGATDVIASRSSEARVCGSPGRRRNLGEHGPAGVAGEPSAVEFGPRCQPCPDPGAPPPLHAPRGRRRTRRVAVLQHAGAYASGLQWHACAQCGSSSERAPADPSLLECGEPAFNGACPHTLNRHTSHAHEPSLRAVGQFFASSALLPAPALPSFVMSVRVLLRGQVVLAGWS